MYFFVVFLFFIVFKRIIIVAFLLKFIIKKSQLGVKRVVVVLGRVQQPVGRVHFAYLLF